MLSIPRPKSAIFIFIAFFFLIVLFGCTSVESIKENNLGKNQSPGTLQENQAQKVKFFVLLDNFPDFSNKSPIFVSGKTNQGNRVVINGRSAQVMANGTFRLQTILSEGKNMIEVVVSDSYGNKNTIKKTVELVSYKENLSMGNASDTASTLAKDLYVPPNGTVRVQSIPVHFKIIPRTTQKIGINLPSQNLLEFGSIMQGTNTALIKSTNTLTLENKLPSPVHIYFNATGAAAPYIVLQGPLTLYGLAEKRVVAITVFAPPNSPIGEYNGTLQITEIR
ncbi:hypothetical protein FJZ26_04120 [Candidatus Parvarchaeota archaeon]|nr:hypothetical protein [Candidatus Parvarchaeota archaeon]